MKAKDGATFMALDTLLFSSKGKVKRQEFLIGFVISIILTAVLIFIPVLIDYQLDPIANFNISITIILYILAFINSVYSTTICLGCKRLRDMGLSPWWIILAFIPLLQLLYFVLFFYPSKNP
jgi:uncharacterized membrane protein YhaH (DUF805 family)